MVFRFIDQPSVAEVKEILELVDSTPVMTQAQIALAEAMAESTFSSLASIVSLFLPAGLSQEADVLYRTVDNRPLTMGDSSSSVVQRRLLDLLKERGPLRGRQIDTHFRKVDWRKVASYLVKKGVLECAVCVATGPCENKIYQDRAISCCTRNCRSRNGGSGED